MCSVNEVDLNFWCCYLEYKELSCSEAGVLIMLGEGENL